MPTNKINQVSRIAASSNEYAGEIYVEFDDCHFQMDETGSQSETSKTS
jgi:hypothetical protein